MLPGTSALLGKTVSFVRGLAVVAAAGACMMNPSQARAQAALAFDERVGEVEGWRIGYSKALAGCFAAATFTDKTTVWLGYGAKLQFYLAFTNTGWRSIETGKTYQILVNAQGYGRWNGKFLGFARGDERGVIIANLKEKFLLDLARAGGMTVSADQKRIAQLSLAGSRSALAEILTCQRARIEQAKADAAAMPPDKKETRSSSGTGFFVSTEGHVLTNYHVAGNCKTVTVMQPGLPAQEAKVVARDQRNDLTLLLTSFKPEAVPAFRKPVRLGESVAVYGFPLAGVLASGGNFTLGNITALAGLADDSTQFQISAPVQPGNSGGPLLDKHGNAVGVIVAKLNVLSVAKVTNDVAQNVNFAIKATTAVNFLETNGLTPPGGESTADLDPADLADKATKFTVKVNCN